MKCLVNAAVCAFALLAAIPAIAQRSTVPSQSTVVQPQEQPPMHIGGSVRPPMVIHSAEPNIQNKAGISWQVYLWVETDGTPSHIKIVKGSGGPEDDVIVATIKQYRFKPATLNGMPVKVDIYIDINIDTF